MENSYVAIANFEGVDFFVGAYDMGGTPKPEARLMKLAEKQIRFWFYEEWGLKVQISFALRVIPQAEMSDIPPLLCMAEEVFKNWLARGPKNDNTPH